MKKILLLLLLLNCNLIYAQKYTETYIKDANKVAEQWLNNIDNMTMTILIANNIICFII